MRVQWATPHTLSHNDRKAVIHRGTRDRDHNGYFRSDTSLFPPRSNPDGAPTPGQSVADSRAVNRGRATLETRWPDRPQLVHQPEPPAAQPRRQKQKAYL